MTCSLIFLLMQTSYEQQEESINTDRPDQSDGTYILPAKQFQVESGLTLAHNLFFHDTMLRYGVTKSAEVRLLTDYGFLQEGSQTSFAFAPVAVSAKQRVFSGNKYIPKMTAVAYIRFPFTASQNIRPDKVQTTWLMAFENNLSGNIFLDYNGGVTIPVDNENAHWFLTSSLGFNLSRKTTFYCEYFSAFPNARGASNNIDAGFLYLIRNNLQVDLVFGSSVEPSKKSEFATTGVSYRFKK